MNVKHKKIVWSVVLAISLFCFVIMTPGMSKFYYEVSSGNIYLNLIERGVESEWAKNVAISNGIFSSALMTLGFPVSILIMILIVTGIILQSKYDKYLKRIFPLVCILGAILIAVSRVLYLPKRPFVAHLTGALGIWFIIALFFLLILMIAWVAKKLTRRLKH